jgi:hypothetical protein
MDIDHTTEPWMPRIKHLSSFGNIGFAAFACTTPNGLTRASVIAARVNSEPYNPNSWLDFGGALQQALAPLPYFFGAVIICPVRDEKIILLFTHSIATDCTRPTTSRDGVRRFVARSCPRVWRAPPRPRWGDYRVSLPGNLDLYAVRAAAEETWRGGLTEGLSLS